MDPSAVHPGRRGRPVRELAEHHVPEHVATEVERILIDGNDAVVIGEIRQTARPD